MFWGTLEVGSVFRLSIASPELPGKAGRPIKKEVRNSGRLFYRVTKAISDWIFNF